MIASKTSKVSEMALQVKLLATKSDNLSLIQSTHSRRKSTLTSCLLISRCTEWHTHKINTILKKKISLNLLAMAEESFPKFSGSLEDWHLVNSKCQQFLPQWTGASSLSRDSCQIRMVLHEEKAAQTEADTVAPQPPHTWTHGWKQKCPLTLPLVTGKVGNRALLQDWYFANLSRRALLRETHVLFHLGSFVLKKKKHSYHVL